ncbi:MAG: sugar ABC transporter ATP-binding protein [Blastopirellula sp. JB062]
MSDSSSPLLQISGVGKRYGDNQVLTDCRLDVRAGEIHALLGGNGAGKSTLVRIISGLISPNGGQMSLADAAYLPRNKRDAETAGVEIVQQEFNLIPTLSVAENLLLTRLPALGGVIRRGELHRRAKAALERFDLREIATDALVETLGVGQQQMVEIAAALDRRCRLLILDEPTAALSASEAESLFVRLHQLRDQGVGIIYISHRLDEVSRLADRLTVLRDGQYVGTYATADLSTDQMVDLMTGELRNPPIAAATPPRDDRPNEQKPRPYALQVERLSGGIVDRVSLAVEKGERLGIAGLIGSGRTELLRLIFGADVAASGSIYLGDDPTPRRFRHPSQAVAAGIAMVTEDRKKNGLLLPQSIRVNTSLASLSHLFSRGGVINAAAENEAAAVHCRAMETRCRNLEQPVATLSGGNQQKVVVARWLTTAAEVYLFDEPTRGIDVPARRKIYQLIDTLASEGKGIVIVSSDLEELLETCDRIAVMSNGKLVAEFARPNLSHDRIMQAAFSGYLDRSSPA